MKHRDYRWSFLLAIMIIFTPLSADSGIVTPGVIELPETGQTSCYCPDDGAGGTCPDTNCSVRTCFYDGDACTSDADCNDGATLAPPDYCLLSWCEDPACTSPTATGQDGKLQMGVAWPIPRFTNPDGSTPVSGGVVLDQLTGLYWQRDGDASSLRTFSSGITYCESTQDGLGGWNDWRMPNILELESLTHAGQGSTAAWLNLPGQGFQDIQAWYWVSNKYAAYVGYGWVFNLGPSVPIGDVYGSGWAYNTYMDPEEDWAASHYVLCVRGGANGANDPTYPANVRKTGQTTIRTAGDDGSYQWGVTAWWGGRFTDNGNTMTDNLTGLMWTKSGNRIAAETGGPITGYAAMARVTVWTQALDFISDMNNGTNNSLLCGGDAVCENFGYTDWRLPNKKEIYSLTHWEANETFIPAGDEMAWRLTTYGFTDLCGGWCGTYWTSTTDPSNNGYVFGISLSSGAGLIGAQTHNSTVFSSGGWWNFPGRLVWPVRTAGCDDGDGVACEVENSAPNFGDGDNDGTRDLIQPAVTSLPSATGQGYVTVVTSGGCSQNQNVQTSTETPDDPDYNYPYGLVGFELPCSSATVRIYFHETTDLTGFTYRKYGPMAPTFGPAEWYDLPNVTFGTELIGGQTVAYAEFTLTDGGLGDDTGIDGMIIDQGGPGQLQPALPVSVPTMSQWGMIIFLILVGVGSIYYLRRQRTV